MVDIHTHVLPEIDDGAADMLQTQAMLRQAAAAGITDLVATPHADLRYQFDSARCRRLLTDIMAAAGAEIPRLHLGCELHLTYDNVLACLDAPANFTIAGGSWLLVELPEDGLPDSLTDILASLTDAGLRPIIAHPERSRSVRKRLDLLNSLADLGCTFQITAGTLEGQFGRSLQKSAHELLRRGFAHFIASDAHDDVYRRPDMTAAFDLVRRQYGEQRAQALCRDNPLAVVENRVLPLHAAGVRPLPPQRKWFDFARWRQPKSRGA